MHLERQPRNNLEIIMYCTLKKVQNTLEVGTYDDIMQLEANSAGRHDRTTFPR